MTKSPAERSIEAITWASIVIWLGFMLVAGGLQETWLVLMVLGIILLSSAIYQRSRQWETSLSIWIFGIWMAVFSVVETVNMLVGSINDGAGLDIDLSVYLGIALVSMGVAGILRVVQGPRTQATRIPRDYNANATGSAASADPRPRIVTDNFGAGFYDSSASRSFAATNGQATSARERASQFKEATQFGAQSQQYDAGTRAGQSASYDPYDQPTQYATGADRGYQEASQEVQHQGGYAYDQAQYGQQNQPEYDYYDETDWDAPPQVQRSAQPQRGQKQRRQPRESSDVNNLEARVEDIIRRSRERRNVPPEDMDLPY